MHKLICANVVRKWHMAHFVMAWLNPVYVQQGGIGLIFVFRFSLFVFHFSFFAFRFSFFVFRFSFFDIRTESENRILIFKILF